MSQAAADLDTAGTRPPGTSLAPQRAAVEGAGVPRDAGRFILAMAQREGHAAGPSQLGCLMQMMQQRGSTSRALQQVPASLTPSLITQEQKQVRAPFPHTNVPPFYRQHHCQRTLTSL